MEKRRIQNWTLLAILIIIMIFGLAAPALAEKITLLGNRIQYSVKQERLMIEGQAELLSEDVIIHSDQMQAIYRDGQVISLTATGSVELIKNGDTFYADEFTYHVKKKTGIILEIRGAADIKDSQEKAYLSGKEATYSEDFIEIFDGHMTTCDLDHPHYLFKAKRVEFYPDDKIKAWHLTFWELNGRVPLFYWPYYVISLKDEEKDFTPEFGYSPATGFFVKTIYRYYLMDQRGELYADYFQKTGPAGGFKQYYMDDGKNIGYVYAYLQKQDKNKTIPYLVAKHSQSAEWGAVKFNSNTSFYRYGTRDTLSSANNLAYIKGGNSLRWDGVYSGAYTPVTNSNTLKNTLKAKWKLGGVTFDGDFSDDYYFHRPTSSYWQGFLRASQYKGLYDWSALVQKKGNADRKLEFYYLPELTVNLKGSGLDRKNALRPYISPFTYNTQVGYYVEKRTEAEALRWHNKLTFRKEIPLFKSFRLALGAEGQMRLYSSNDWVYSYSPSVEVRMTPLHGFSSSVKYSYGNGDGSSPFYFDRLTTLKSQQVVGNMTYSKSGFTFSTSTTYNLVTEKFSPVSNSANYVWGENRANQVSLAMPYDIEQKKFGIITAKGSMKQDDLTFSFESQVNPLGWKWTKQDTNLDWKINEDWHIQVNTAFNPSKGFDVTDTQTKGAVKLIRNLHCREISVSYDAVRKEIWFQYQITAFPKQKVRLGSSENDRFQFDFNLGGNTNAQ